VVGWGEGARRKDARPTGREEDDASRARGVMIRTG
jgi:hypothetical protein